MTGVVRYDNIHASGHHRWRTQRGEESGSQGGKADIATPMRGMGSGVFEIALPFRGDAFRLVYAVQIGNDIWVVHAFQKKSTRGIKTPQRELDVIRDRLKRLKEMWQ